MTIYKLGTVVVDENYFWENCSTVSSFSAPESIMEKIVEGVRQEEFAIKQSGLLVDSTFPTTEEKIKRFAEIKLPTPEGHSTRHKAANTTKAGAPSSQILDESGVFPFEKNIGLCGLLKEINKSKNTTRMASDNNDNLTRLKDHYCIYFKNDEWAFNKIAAAFSLQDLEIAIEQITGRKENETDIHKNLEITKEDLKPYIKPKHLKETDFKANPVLTGEYEPKQFKFKIIQGADGQIFTPVDSFKAGKKESEGKLFYEFDWEFIEAAAKRMQENKGGKYPPFNWQKPINIEELKQAINRHHIEVMKGNYKDGEDDLGHIVSYFCNSMMLWHQLKNHKQQ